MPTQLVRPKPTRILVLNPNSSQSMTDGLKPVIDSVDLGSVSLSMLLFHPFPHLGQNDAFVVYLY